MTAKKEKTLSDLVNLSEKLQELIWDKTRESYIRDFDNEPFETVEGVIKKDIDGIFSDKTKQLMQVLGNISDCTIALGELAYEEKKEKEERRMYDEMNTCVKERLKEIVDPFMPPNITPGF